MQLTFRLENMLPYLAKREREVSVDEYLSDTHRVVRVVFPDSNRLQPETKSGEHDSGHCFFLRFQQLRSVI